MLIIDNKKYRNLQEQVGYNTEQIEKIFSFLDGLEVEDNLIKLDNASGTLTTEEMEIVSRDVAFIIYSNNLYLKTTTSATEFIFKQVALSATDNGTYNILQSFRIVVTRASGAYAYAANTVLSLYNKSEMDSLLADKADAATTSAALATKANLSGANFTGDITAPSIIENMSGYGFTASPDIATNGFVLNYVGAVKNGNKVTFAVAGTFTPNSSTVVNPSLGAITFPTAIGQKLYPDSLGALNNQYVSFFNTVNTSVSKNVRTTKTGGGNNGVSFQFFSMNSSFVLDTPYSFRFEVTFLLSDNLAS